MSKFFSLVTVSLLLSATSLGQNVPYTTTIPNPNYHFVLPQAFTPATGLYNFTRTWRPLLPVTDPASPMFTLTSSASLLGQSCQMNTTYINGWGETIESIKRGAQTGGNDIVIGYDNRSSLTQTSFLPYAIPPASQFQSDPFYNEKTSYDGAYPTEGSTSFGQTVASSNNQIPTVMNYSPGISFIGNLNGTMVQTFFNDPNNFVHNIPVYSYANSLTQNGYYLANQLTVKEATMQNGGNTYEFYDFNGRMVCKKVYVGGSTGDANYLITYYVYDDVGRLRMIIPPAYAHSGDDPNDYHFTYNAYGQITAKGVPSQTGTQNTIYDSRHRPVLFQTPLMASEQKYQFTIYDNLDRVLIQGYIADPYGTDARHWQNFLDQPSTAPISTYPLLNYLINGTAGANITSISNCEIDVINYYDQLPASDPAFTGATFDNSFASDYQTGITPVASGVTKGLLLGSKVLVRDSNLTYIENKWITSTYFYDYQGQLIQTQTLNPWNLVNKDVVTFQYSFAHQKLLEIDSYHDHAASNKTTNKVVKVCTYDNNNDGRLLNTKISVDNTGFRTLNAFTYDNLGRVKSKTMGSIEVQNLDYNIRGQLAGINSAYTNNGANPNNNINFGCTLNYDNGFSMPRLDGKIAGMMWRGAGASAPERAYGYRYDAAGRLTDADFDEYETGITYINGQPATIATWTNSQIDYSMNGVVYDANGNIQAMNQMGTPALGAPPMPIDQLTFHHHGNQLFNVKDDANATTPMDLGDFNNGPNPCGTGVTCQQYWYDVDGNLTEDDNKQITVAYNDADQPTMVTYANNGNGVGTIKYVYAGNGALVEKIVTDPVGGPITYRYWGPFVYKYDGVNDQLQYMLHEEGRARYLPDTLAWRFDYFVKDHLGNVRSTVTADEQSGAIYRSTYEVVNAAAENLSFTTVDEIREDNPLPVEDNTKAVVLNGGSSSVGTSILLHTMAGDQFDISAQSYWETQSGTPTYQSASDLLSNLVSTLAGGSAGAAYAEGIQTGMATVVNNKLSGNLETLQALMNNATTSDAPKAYINYLVFDENMQLIPAQSGAIQVGSTPGSWQTFGTSQPIVAALNGYLLLYISNVQNQDVHFDNVTIAVHQGRLLQEQNYYPYGLPINEGQNPNALANKFQYQGKEQNKEMGLNWADFGARHYDTQLGRFCIVDPADQFPSGYTGMGNDPANNIDPSGMVSGTASNPGQAPIEAGGAPVEKDYTTDMGSDAGRADYQMPISDAPFLFWTIAQQRAQNHVGHWESHWVWKDNETFSTAVNYQVYKYTWVPDEFGSNIHWMEKASKRNTTVGLLASVLEQAGVGLSVGGNLKLYTNAWKGNQYVKTLNFGKVGKGFGIATAVIGTGLDLWGVKNYYMYGPNADNVVAPTKALTNAGATSLGLFGGISGAVGSAIYFGIDAYYPGGWPGAMQYQQNLIKENQSAMPNWQLNPKDN